MTTAAGFDFRSPPAGPLEKQAGQWLAAAGKRAGPAWAKFLPFPVELSAGPADAAPAGMALAALPADAVGFRLDAADAPPLLLALPRPGLLGLLAGLLGETPSDPPADRELTALELSLSAFLAREMLLAPLEQGWPLPEQPLALTASAPGSPRTVWRRPAEDMTISARLTALTPFGDVPLTLLIPRAGRWRELTAPMPRDSEPAGERAHIEALVREMTVEMDVLLGEADVTMLDLAELKAGDLVMLRQRVDEPLAATVSGATKFRVWPGAVGNRAAVRIEATAGP